MILSKLNRFQDAKMLVVEPFANIYEEGPSVIVALEMPGVDRETLAVELENQELQVHGRKRNEAVPKEYKAVCQERTAVEYQRTFEVHTHIDRERIQASYENGILKIMLPKLEVLRPKKIEIKS